jgi:chorismate mutase / prephenate dehydratase
MTDKKIAFLGPKVSFTYEASLKYFGEKNDFVALDKISDIFSQVKNDIVDFGVVPAENSTGGSIVDTLDCFIDTNLKVYDQITLEIVQNLMSISKKEEIKRIYSHPQSFLQCANYLKINFKNAEYIETLSNTKAAILAKKEPFSAAIGPLLCAKEYELNVLEENINDSKKNQTRFFIINKEINDVKRKKSLILISVPNKSGSLFNILKNFKNYKINMTRIESRPSKVKNWEYFFIIEYENSSNERNDQKFVSKLKSKCDYYVYLGTY